MDIKVLVVQLETISGDIEVNIRKVKKLLEESGNTSADLIIMPELWSIGWDCKKFDKFYENLPIRKVTISCGNLQNKDGIQLNLFEHLEEIREQEQIDEAILKIKDKFGKNAILKASSLLDDSTIKERNKKIGGHSA